MSVEVRLTPKPFNITDPSRRVSVVLVCMPWPPAYTPNLALATLASFLEQHHRDVQQLHSHLRWLQFLETALGGDVYSIYTTVGEDGAYTGVGDFVFGRVLGERSSRHIDRFANYLAAFGLPPLPLADLLRCADAFVEQEAEHLAEVAPEGALVGLTSTFTQTVPSLALSRALKTRRPDLLIALGGANMSSGRGRVLLDNFAHLDAVAFGEGESSILGLLEIADTSADGVDHHGVVPGAVTRRRDGQIRSGDQPELFDMSRLPNADFGSYFETLEETGLDAEFEPALSWEIGRGCWWGEKRHCTFCGLNGELMTFRRRPPEKVATSIIEQSRQYQVLDVLFADNILHPDDIEDIFTKLPDDLDLRMHLEVKADLDAIQMLKLRDAGVWHLQPGIESLARGPLRTMRKGVTPMQNVRFLRWGEELGLTISWNILVGFPDETIEDHRPMIDQLDKLVHLEPPSSVGPLAIVRNSPLFDDPEHAPELSGPSQFNSLVYEGLDSQSIVELSDVFDPVVRSGLSKADVETLREATTEWSARHAETFLFTTSTARGSAVVRRVGGRSETVAEIENGWQKELWAALRLGMSPTKKREASLGPAFKRVSEDEVDTWLESLVNDAGVVYHDQRTLVAIATSYYDHLPWRLS